MFLGMAWRLSIPFFKSLNTYWEVTRPDKLMDSIKPHSRNKTDVIVGQVCVVKMCSYYPIEIREKLSSQRKKMLPVQVTIITVIVTVLFIPLYTCSSLWGHVILIFTLASQSPGVPQLKFVKWVSQSISQSHLMRPSLWQYVHLSLLVLPAKDELFGCFGITCSASKLYRKASYEAEAFALGYTFISPIFIISCWYDFFFHSFRKTCSSFSFYFFYL